MTWLLMASNDGDTNSDPQLTISISSARADLKWERSRDLGKLDYWGTVICLPLDVERFFKQCLARRKLDLV